MTKQEIEIVEDMLISVVDLLVEKGIITQEEYESRVKQRLEDNRDLTRFEELEK
jgi:hypothetical protein